MKNNVLGLFIILLVILSFLPDWGFLYEGNSRPTISFPEIGVIIFIIIWFLQKLLQKDPKFSQKSVKIFILIFSIFLVATIGGVLHFNNINWNEHFKSSIKLIFWAIFMFCWIDVMRELSSNSQFSNRAWKYYLNCALIISSLAIFQYIFYQFTVSHLNLNPFLNQRWGVIGWVYRATAIYVEPSWLGIILMPPLIAQGRLFFSKSELSYLWKFLFLLAGVLVSLSLASFIVLGVWGLLTLLKWIFQKLGIFIKEKIKKREINTIIVVFFLIIIGLLIGFKWLFPLITPRIITEFNVLVFNLTRGRMDRLTSGIRRFSSYEGFWTILKKSPLFGVGFDQIDYVSSLMGKYFEATTSGIIGFIGTSAGLLGIFLIFYILKFIWNGGEKKSLKIKLKNQPHLLIIGRGIVVALFLEQLILYAGILNADFWLLLAFAYLFISSGRREIEKSYKSYAK